MWKTMTMIFMLIVAPFSSVQNCVSTAPEVTALMGSDVNLRCNFFQCVSGTVDWKGMDTVEWEFESNRSNSSDHIIDHNLRSSWPNVNFNGNLSREACDFSIRLQSAKPKHSGTYTCRFRLKMNIHKNSTKVIIRTDPIHRGFRPLESGDSSANRSPRQLALCCITVLVIMVGVALVGKWVWTKKTLKSPVVESSLNTFAPLQGNPTTPEGPQKDANTYVTLQGIKLAPPPPPTLNVDGIYITMRFNQGDPELSTHVPRKRSGLPTDWMAEETTASSPEETPASPDASTLSQTADGTYAAMH